MFRGVSFLTISFLCAFFLLGNASASNSCETLLSKAKSSVSQNTVQELVESVFDGTLQSYAVQREFQDALTRVRLQGYEANAQMIERLGLLKIHETKYEPTFSSIVKNMNSILAEQGSRAAIKIGVVFQKEQDFDSNNPDHWISLEPHEKIPVGYKLWEGTTFLPGAALWSALARGHFPATFISGSLNSPRIAPRGTAHDLLGHLPTYLVNPEYASSYVKVAQTIMKKYREHSAKIGKPSWSFIYKTGLFARVFVFNEGLTKSRADVILDNLELLGLSGIGKIPRAKDLTLKDLTPDTKDLADLKSTLAKLIDLTPMISRPIGGATLVSTQDPSTESNFIHYLVSTVHRRFDLWQSNASSGDQIRIISKLIGVIRGYHITMSQINFDELAVDIFRDEAYINSPMSHFFNERSGYISATTEVVNALGFPYKVYYGGNAFLHRFSPEGWNKPLPTNWSRSQ